MIIGRHNLLYIFIFTQMFFQLCRRSNLKEEKNGRYRSWGVCGALQAPPMGFGLSNFRLSERLNVTILMKNHLITTTRVFDRLRQSTPYLSVVLWSYSEKHSGQVRYLSQFCSLLSEQIDRLKQILFSSLDPRVTNGEKENSWDWLGFSNTIRPDKAGTDMLIKAKKSIMKHFFHLNLLLSI